jgi:hypothetical protein
MSIEEKIVAALDPLVGGRCYAEVLPQSLATWPAIRYTLPSTTPENTICGSSDEDAYRVQIDIYGVDFDVVTALRKPVFAAIEAAFDTAERVIDVSDFEADGRLYRRMIEYTVRSE